MLPDIFPQLCDRHFITANNGPGIVDQNINVAKVLRHLTYHGLNLLTVAQITPHPQAAPAQCLNFLRHASNATPLLPDLSRRQLLRWPVHIGHSNIRTLRCQLECCSPTNAFHTPSARNQGNFALQSSHALPPLLSPSPYGRERG
jgi:hypothetical protein